MIKSKYKWNVKTNLDVKPDELVNVLYLNKGITDIDDHLGKGFKDFNDSYLLNDMKKAVDRIHHAISNEELIMIYGDYDCDGVTSITVLYKALKMLGAKVIYDLPNRFKDGYGLNLNKVDDFINKSIDLLITVDNGIVSFEEAKVLKENNIDLIITDHHEIQDVLPEAHAVIHTMLSDYPFKELAGVGVAFKLACALHNRILHELIDIVMIGTIADMMPIIDENKAIVNEGLKQVLNTQNIGLRKLLQYLDIKELNETTVAFKIAPRINACGRIDSALIAVDLFCLEDESKINETVSLIEDINNKRKDLTKETVLLCEEKVDNEKNVIIVNSPKFHEGVLGIVAQRLVESYFKVSIVLFENDNGIAKGSVRSFQEINIMRLLEKNSDILLKFGGHQYAAGIQINSKNIPLLEKRLDEALSEYKVEPKLKIEAMLKTDEITLTNVQKLINNSLENNLLLFKGAKIYKKMLLNEKHTKFILETKNNKFDAIAFNNPSIYYQITEGDHLDIVGTLSINEWNNRSKVQIMIKDICVNHLQVIDYRNNLLFKKAKRYFENDSKTLVINKLPNSLEKFESTIKENKPHKVYFGLVLDEFVSHQVINRSILKNVFQTIKHNNEITKKELINITKIDKFIINNILEVFLELNFVIIEDKVIKIIDNLEKKSLEESKKYCDLLLKMEVEDKLLLSTTSEIKQYIKNIMEESK